ncbi:MAG: O-antigen ligase family protein [Agathobaculum sp.]|jgi:O-antigen ligase|uniref:O-antigen ligase family protein n=1 Tax=Agathobaculum sp. TaxID=2048138 RepID=UPI003D8EBA14
MKAMWENSLLVRLLLRLREWYHAGAIAGFFRSFHRAYPHSRFRRMWDGFCAAPVCTAANSGYARLLAALRRFVEYLGDVTRQSFIYRACLAVWKPVSAFLGGGVVGRVLRFFGVRGLLLVCLALYLPLDVLIRWLSTTRGYLPGFIGSVWDEGMMLAAFAYILWHTAMRRAPLQSRATPVDAYLLLFIGVGFFLMCAVSPYPSIALDGYRAVVQYLFWFFLVTRLIEDDRDFGIFYGTLVVMAVLIGLHGIYQFIVAAPIPAGWVSQTEESVRTRVYSITGSPNIMGSFLVLFAPMVAGIAYYSKKLWVKVLAICCTGMMCLSIIFTFSKGAWGGLAVAVIVFAVFLDRRLIALMGVAGAGALIAIPSIANRITYLFTADYVEASQRAGRMVRWETGLDLLHESNPWLGFGLGRFGGAVAMQNKIIEETDTFSYFYMDNYYLKTLVEMGYLGLIFFIVLLFGLVLWCLRAIGRTKFNETDRSRVLAVSMFAGMCGVLVHCYFENIFEVPYMMAYFWSLAAAVLYLGYFRKKRNTAG